MSTLASLTRAPLGSDTVPVMLPVLSVVCPRRLIGARSAIRQTSAATERRRPPVGEFSFSIFDRPFGVLLKCFCTIGEVLAPGVGEAQNLTWNRRVRPQHLN